MIISIIAAVAKNNVIGKDNGMIWRLSDDLKRFKRLTLGHHILMGRKTFESLNKPLPNRTNIVITRNSQFKVEGAFVFDSLKKGIEFALSNGEVELFVIGGGEIYKKILNQTEKIYLTKVDAAPLGDTFFPELNEIDWEITQEETHLANDKNEFNFKFVDLKRKLE